MAQETLNFWSDVLLAAGFILLGITLILTIGRGGILTPRLRDVAILCASGLLVAAAGIIASHIWTTIDRTEYELLIKLLAALLLAGACYLAWPLVRFALRHKRSIASLPDPELLIMERDDLSAANTELEREIVRRSYQLERVNRQMRLALMGSPITVFRQDRERRYTWIFNPPEHFAPDVIGKTETDIFPPEAASQVSEIKERAMRTQDEQSAEIRMRLPSGHYWYLLRSQPDYNEDAEVIGTISCAIDITEQKRQQQRQQLLMREVTHRAKNLLAVLQGIVRQTAHRTNDFDAFIASFTARLQAIARSHDLLVQDDWRGTHLATLIESQLAVLSEIDSERVKIHGAELRLTPVAVQNFGMAIHELATNAMKYGSLSDANGKVEIDWEIVEGSKAADADEEERGEQLRLVWRETGGPAVTALNDSGFGRTLLERVVGRALGGTADLDFSPDGLVCTLTLPVSRVIANRATLNALEGELVP